MKSGARSNGLTSSFLKVKGFFFCFLVLFRVDESCFEHTAEHSQLSLSGEILVFEWVETRRMSDQTGDQGRFR